MYAIGGVKSVATKPDEPSHPIQRLNVQAFLEDRENKEIKWQLIAMKNFTHGSASGMQKCLAAPINRRQIVILGGYDPDTRANHGMISIFDVEKCEVV